MKGNRHNVEAPRQTPGRRARCRRRRALLRAFTLIELLTIIVILGMLITLTAPSILEATRVFRDSESRMYLTQIESGIRLYLADWRNLPPRGGWPATVPEYLQGLPPSAGTTSDTVAGQLKGAAALVQALRGYRSDDGKTGPGSRYVNPSDGPGKVYQPYVSGELPIGGNMAAPAFLDAFGNEFLYYRFEPGGGSGGGSFVSGHNTGRGPPSLTAYLTDPNSDLYRRDYIVITPGSDRTWMRPGTDEKTDDIANFEFRFEDRD